MEKNDQNLIRKCKKRLAKLQYNDVQPRNMLVRKPNLAQNAYVMMYNTNIERCIFTCLTRLPFFNDVERCLYVSQPP